MKLSEYLLSKAEARWYWWVVFVMTVFESVFLFIPPEVFMTPAIVANKKRAVPITLAAALGSIVGGIIAYAIGVWLFDSVGAWLIQQFASMDAITYLEQVRALVDKWGVLIIVATAFTPIPYKLLGICLGFLNYPIILFVAVSAIFRTGRFAIVGTLLYFFQERANNIVKKYFWPITIGAILAALVGIGIVAMV
ncbi:MAG: VTT domain-containing protein [Alphaproteobacteria bacterium]|nr:VTT domain-containing protein [Alphaproteobacteria bacterium]